MASELDKLAEELERKREIDLTDVFRGTHAQTAMRVASPLEIALRWRLLIEKKPLNDQMFVGNGCFATLQKRIEAVHNLKLIDDKTHRDAHLVRLVRNKFAHASENLHFDGEEMVKLIKQLSTHEAADKNQEAFLKAADQVCDRAAKAARTAEIDVPSSKEN